MVVSHFAYNMMKMPAPWGVLTVKANVSDAILCVQKLNLVVVATSGDPQEVQDADAVAFPQIDAFQGGSKDDQEGGANP